MLAQSEEVALLLSEREARGKGTTVLTNVVVTDCDLLDPEVLYVRAEIAPVNLDDFKDDGAFFSELLWGHRDALLKKEDAYTEKLQGYFQNMLEKPANDSLAYKLKMILEELGREDTKKDSPDFENGFVMGIAIFQM